MRIVVLSERKNNAPEGEPLFMRTASRILEECEKSGIDCEILFPETLRYENLDGRYLIGSEEVEPFEVTPDDTVFVCRSSVLDSTKASSIVSDLERAGFFCVNNLSCLEVCDQKYRCYLRLKEQGIPTPKTVSLPSAEVQDDGTPKKIKNIQQYVNMVGSQFPLVLKTDQGAGGAGVMLVDSPNSLVSVVQTLQKVDPKIDLLLQEKIPYEKDLRVIVLGDEVIAALRRQSKDGDFRSNFSLNGDVTPENIDDQTKQLAIDSASATDGIFVGVDILQTSDGEEYTLEVNASPGTEGIEKATGENIVSKFLDYITDKTNWTNLRGQQFKLTGESYDDKFENYLEETVGKHFNKSLTVRRIESSRIDESTKMKKLMKMRDNGDVFASLCLEQAKSKKWINQVSEWKNQMFEKFCEENNVSLLNSLEEKRDKYRRAFGENWKNVYYEEKWNKYNEEYQDDDLEGTTASAVKRMSQTPGEPMYYARLEKEKYK